MINVDLNDETWHTVRDTPKVTGFVGNDLNPESLSDDDAMKIIGRIKDGALKPKPKVMFEIGDAVRVVDGPFSIFRAWSTKCLPIRAGCGSW